MKWGDPMTIDVYAELTHGDRYTNKLDHPKRPVRPRTPNSDIPADYIDFAERLENFLLAKSVYKEELKAYMCEQSRIEEQFRKELAEEFEVTDHPKEHVLWTRAWEEGHAYGLSEIYNKYSELAELVK